MLTVFLSFLVDSISPESLAANDYRALLEAKNASSRAREPEFEL
jgi:hypothetical protein